MLLLLLLRFHETRKPGKKAYVCNGTACVCAGTQEVVQQKLEQHFKKEEIGYMTCLGRSHENSTFLINGHNYSGKQIDELNDIQKLDVQENYHVHFNNKHSIGNIKKTLMVFRGKLDKVFFKFYLDSFLLARLEPPAFAAFD